MANKLTAYGAVDVPTPHGMSQLRHYIIVCEHATTELDLVRRPSEDANVLRQLLRDHRHAIKETEGEDCDCEPTAKQLGIAASRLS